MKKIIILVIALFCSIQFSVNASQLIVNLKANKEIKDQPYAICIKKYDINFTHGWKYDDIYYSKDGKFNINFETGRYSIAMIYPTCEPFCYNIYFENKNATITFNVQLDRLIVPEKIDSVRMFGNFNGFDNENTINFKFDAKKHYWYLQNNYFPSNLQSFKFYINNEKIAYLLNYPFDTLNVWASPQNLYVKSSKDLIFNPSDYKHGLPNPKVSGTYDTLYNSMCDKLQKLYLETTNKANHIKSKTELNDFYSYYQKQIEVLNTLKLKYEKPYPWAIANLEFLMLDLPIQSESSYARNTKDEVASNKIYKSAAYIEQIRKKTQLLSKLELNELFFSKSIIDDIWYLENGIDNFGINYELNLPYGYAKQMLNNLLTKFDNNEICGEIMKLKAQNVIYNAPELSQKILLELKNKYPIYSGNKDGSISTMLTGLSIREGTVAPPFSVVSLDGKTISLSDLKGKYVFIDFWGSWCSPCRGEIPNIKKMSEEIPESKLVIIGLICHDNEKAYKKFLTDNGVKYQNAVANQEIIDKYGVRAWPTTFLINPEGIIVEKNLRGESITKQVKGLME